MGARQTSEEDGKKLNSPLLRFGGVRGEEANSGAGGSTFDFHFQTGHAARMKKILFLFLSASLSFTALAENSAIVPAPRAAPTNWVARHEGFLAEAKQGKFDLVFIGDSITDGWRNRGLEVWNKFYAPRHALNLGIGGDRTQHVLWRIEHGELDGLKPKAVVLMIGTNNTGKEKDGAARNSTAEVIEGVTAVVKQIRARLPQSRLLLLAIFPRGTVDAPQRAQIKEINTAIAKLDDGKMIKFLDIGKVFLAEDGSIPGTIMPDLLHPNEQGYQRWADAMEPTLAAMLK
jgi:lysophospholipase L1-like esterase